MCSIYASNYGKGTYVSGLYRFAKNPIAIRIALPVREKECESVQSFEHNLQPAEKQKWAVQHPKDLIS